MSQDATSRFRTARGREIDFFRIDLSADTINHEIHKQQLQLIVNTVANDLQCNLQLNLNGQESRIICGVIKPWNSIKEGVDHNLRGGRLFENSCVRKAPFDLFFISMTCVKNERDVFFQ